MTVEKPNKQARDDRDRQALELRKAGVTYQAIADRLGYNSYQAAHKAITTLLQRTVQGSADDVRILEAERLDALTLGVWADAKKGHQGAIDRVLKIMERRAKLLGLDAPTKFDHSIDTYEVIIGTRRTDK